MSWHFVGFSLVEVLTMQGGFFPFVGCGVVDQCQTGWEKVMFLLVGALTSWVYLQGRQMVVDQCLSLCRYGKMIDL